MAAELPLTISVRSYTCAWEISAKFSDLCLSSNTLENYVGVLGFSGSLGGESDMCGFYSAIQDLLKSVSSGNFIWSRWIQSSWACYFWEYRLICLRIDRCEVCGISIVVNLSLTFGKIIESGIMSRLPVSVVGLLILKAETSVGLVWCYVIDNNDTG